ncbi:ras-related protein Rab-24-like [Colletes gigas]|uniref:ras-related protein Rab-24-like n=1 Tax=Colletes gigas TaxID=935657 RepID=UPI001C9BA1D3|nr:ras-related protein Rab-24-like [Colletes gigas]
MRRVDLKVVLLGDSAVGKTSLVERFVNDRFTEEIHYRSTLGGVFTAKQMQHGGHKIIMGIWDTAGEEKYDAMTRLYYRKANAAIVCHDITKLDTFRRASFWIRELRNIEEQCKIYICGTKKDLLEQHAGASPDTDVLKVYAANIQAKVFITSSKTGGNVVTLFDEIAKDFISYPKNIPDVQEIIDVSSKKSKRTCC